MESKAPVEMGVLAVTYRKMGSFRPVRWLSFSVVVLATALAGAQEKLSLEEALRLARTRNGSLAAAEAQVRAARAREKQALAAFFPTITPALTYSDQRREQFTGFPKGTTINSGTTTEIEGRWKILDAGERDISFRSARIGLSVETLNALQTVRETLVDVFTQYFDALRSQELVKVADAQVARAKAALAQTEAQIKVGEAAEKDRFQPEADSLNAEVERLSAEARRRSAEASLKATIGYDMTQGLPELESFEEPASMTVIASPDQLVAFREEGLQNRADLIASRRRLEAQDLGVRLARINAGVTWSVDATFTRTFNADVTNNRLLGVSASIPLFDAGRSKAAIAEAVAGRDSTASQLVQQERNIEASIESAFFTHQLNFDRVRAAKAALAAAKTNYERTSRAFELGAQGADVVAVSTAQVTLATAERNYVEAIFDFYISEVQLQLALGRPIRGEDAATPEREE